MKDKDLTFSSLIAELNSKFAHTYQTPKKERILEFDVDYGNLIVVTKE
jgi:hypothetical protein